MDRKFLVTTYSPKYEWLCGTEELEYDELVNLHEEGYTFDFEIDGEEEIFLNMYDAL